MQANETLNNNNNNNNNNKRSLIIGIDRYLDEFKYKSIKIITCLKVSHTLNVCANQWVFPVLQGTELKK
jgi:hypothetical protein